ncbi:IS110 family transposase [Lentzea sp. NBRC 102530]|uniref:IS110 family transposase n=1 Tax=Lentzea sp. NBRC 102530 TaxID=3032201 RepID=UPI0024A0508C|nr:IS110 family transposase [Lentzea sp. NBRC 102530]GLY55391.1 IS110 family transposase [Lentzea sp. NBRC 102530]
MAKTRSTRIGGPVVPVGEITGGVDTHKKFHVAAAVDGLGRVLGTTRFDATLAGYAALLAWLAGFGPIALVGVEGTGCYGAGLTGFLTGRGVRVVEVDRPNRQRRRRTGKSDPADAIAAAAAAQSGEAATLPKPRTGPVESVRVLREARRLWTHARTAAINTLKALLVTAPPGLRERLEPLNDTALIARCAGFEPVPAAQAATTMLDHGTAVEHVLGELARTITGHTTRIRELDARLHALVEHIAPRTSGLFGVGPGRAAQLLLTAAGPDRLHSEAAFARLTGVAPQDCGSGQTAGRHRLSRTGDRQANSVLYYIVLTRLAWHEPTRTYLEQRLNPNGSNKKHLIRCLKRYLAREIYPRLIADLAAIPSTA